MACLGLSEDWEKKVEKVEEKGNDKGVEEGSGGGGRKKDERRDRDPYMSWEALAFTAAMK